MGRTTTTEPLADAAPTEVDGEKVTEAEAVSDKFESVTLYNSEGVEQTALTPAELVRLEFNGYSRNKDRFKK